MKLTSSLSNPIHLQSHPFQNLRSYLIKRAAAVAARNKRIGENVGSRGSMKNTKEVDCKFCLLIIDEQRKWFNSELLVLDTLSLLH
jgi:hypothetical protein